MDAVTSQPALKPNQMLKIIMPSASSSAFFWSAMTRDQLALVGSGGGVGTGRHLVTSLIRVAERAERAQNESGRAEDDAQTDARDGADGRRPGKLIDDEAENGATHDAAGKHAAQAEEVAPTHRVPFGSTFGRKLSQRRAPS